MRPAAPVVEVAGHDERGVVRHFRTDQRAKALHLLLAMTFHEAQVHADHVDVDAGRGLQGTVQQAALLGAGDGDVVVAVVRDRKLGEHRVAVMALGVDRIATVGMLLPDGIGKELILWLRRPAGVPGLMPAVFAQDLLQTDHIGTEGADRLAQFTEYEAAVERAETLVNVEGQQAHFLRIRRGGWRLDRRVGIHGRC